MLIIVIIKITKVSWKLAPITRWNETRFEWVHGTRQSAKKVRMDDETTPRRNEVLISSDPV